MTLKQCLLVFNARRRVILLAWAATVVITLLVNVAMPRKYVAQTSLLVDVKNDPPVAGAVLPDMTAQNYMANQVEIVKSDRVAQRVIKLLGAEREQAARERWQRSAAAEDGDAQAFERHYGEWLSAHLKVKVTPVNNLMTLSFAAANPQLAADGANAFATAYMDSVLDLRVEPVRQSARWFDERLEKLRATIQEAKRKLSEYQRSKEMLAPDKRYDQELAHLTALNTRLAEIQEKRIVAGSKQQVLAGSSSEDAVKSPDIQNLKNEIFRASNRLSEMSLTAGPNYPPRRQLEAHIAGLRAQLRQKTGEELRKLPAARATASKLMSEQESALQALIDEQQKKVLTLLPEHDAMAMLVKDVETAENAYESVAKRMTQSTLEAKTEHGNVSVLTPALLPNGPASPRLLLNFLLAHPAGLLLGLLLALLLESLDRRIRSVEDLGETDQLPLLGILQEAPVRGEWTRLLTAAAYPALPFRRLPE